MSLITRNPKTLALWARLEKNRWGSREVTFQMTRIAAGKQMSPIYVCWVRMLMTERQANKTQGCYQNCTSNLFTKKKNFNVLSLAGFIPRIPYAYQRGGWIFHAALFWFPLFASLGRCSSLPPLPLFFFFFVVSLFSLFKYVNPHLTFLWVFLGEGPYLLCIAWQVIVTLCSNVLYWLWNLRTCFTEQLNA